MQRNATQTWKAVTRKITANIINKCKWRHIIAIDDNLRMNETQACLLIKRETRACSYRTKRRRPMITMIRESYPLERNRNGSSEGLRRASIDLGKWTEQAMAATSGCLRKKVGLDGVSHSFFVPSLLLKMGLKDSDRRRCHQSLNSFVRGEQAVFDQEESRWTRKCGVSGKRPDV